MKYILILATIFLMIFVPRGEIKEIGKDVVRASEDMKIIEPTPSKMPEITPTPTKTIYTPTSEIESLICQYFKGNCEDAIKVAKCESGLRPHAVGDHAIEYFVDGEPFGKSYGIFQIRHLPGRPDPEKLLDPVFNIEYAANLYNRSSWNPWLNCSYKLGLNI